MMEVFPLQAIALALRDVAGCVLTVQSPVPWVLLLLLLALLRAPVHWLRLLDRLLRLLSSARSALCVLRLRDAAHLRRGVQTRE